MDFLKRLHNGETLLLDGAMGTMLFELIPEYSGSFELLNLERPDVIRNIHRTYIDAGADIIEANSFGGSPLKLAEYGLADRCEQINGEAVRIARSAAEGRGVIVAGAMGSTGMLVEPMGPVKVEDIYTGFCRQARSLASSGADIILIETMTDIQEARLALIAAKECTSLPVICSMSFEKNGKTVSGTGMLAAFATLSQCGASVVGANCSMGPDGLAELYYSEIETLRGVGLPFSVWANAGMPEVVNGITVYNIGPEEFANHSMRIVDLGMSVVGGCCGTTPGHIAALRKRLDAYRGPRINNRLRYHYMTSRYGAVDVDAAEGVLKIGERLNPTARKKFAAELKEGQNNFLREESRLQQDEGAHLLDINVGVPGIDEVAAMRRAIGILSGTVQVPLAIDSDNGGVLDAALMMYPGVPLVNSINGKKKSIETVLPLLKKYGSFVVALCMDDTGIHRDAESRIAIGEKLISFLASEGIDASRIFIDPLILTESAEPGSAIETLKVIAHFAGQNVKTSIGLSNISFGLPQRKYINNAFLAMASARGLTAAIVNPSAVTTGISLSEEELLGVDFLTGKDPGAARYIARFGGESQPAASRPAEGAPGIGDPLEKIYILVVEGNSDEIVAAVEYALETFSPEDIMNRGLIKALEKVGDYYSAGTYFLPQMIASAEAMKAGFARLKPLLAKSGVRKKGKAVICTVRGDVHDIGKNIVAMMMENHGFEVIDLGKDVPSEDVMAAVKEHDPDILCLSSLLTTTMNEMKILSDAIREQGLEVRVLVGGAVVTREYAETIDAMYGKDAVDGVKIATKIMEGK